MARIASDWAPGVILTGERLEVSSLQKNLTFRMLPDRQETGAVKHLHTVKI
jgi:hypothetical protein